MTTFIAVRVSHLAATHRGFGWLRVAAVVLVALHVALRASGAQQGRSPGDAAEHFLATEFKFSDDDFRDLAGRVAIAKTLATVDGREVATVGAVKVAVPAAYYADQLREIAAFKEESPAVLQIGVFSSPAIANDAAALSLDPMVAESLRSCRPGDCEVQFSADAIARVTRALAGRPADVTSVAERNVRDILVDLVNGYRSRGDAALMTYVDDDEPVAVAREFRTMIASRPAVLERRFPDLHRHVVGFPRASSPDVDDLVYWSKEKMGPAVIVSVTHLSIMRVRGTPFETFAAASKQIYGSHYFDASLGLTILFGLAPDNEPGMLLVYVNRSRIDALRGFWGGLKRTIVRSRTRSSVRSSLLEVRGLVERRFRSSLTSRR